MPKSLIKPCIVGVSGTKLTAQERDFLSEHQPWGFIIFARNCEDPEQLSQLVADLKSCVTHKDVPILIDQEGGRVARLKPPHWPSFPSAGYFVDIAVQQGIEVACEAVYSNYADIAHMLSQLGINVNCVPMVDVLFPTSDGIIGDRAFGSNVEHIIRLAHAVVEAMAVHDVLPVLKHIPGHGRATADSHKTLPVVDVTVEQLREIDFVPFKALANSCPLGMTAHIVYSAIDSQHCATQSPDILRVIREEIGFTNILMTDDLSMHALKGTFADRARISLEAGCDIVLHCNGEMDEMVDMMSALQPCNEVTMARLQAVWS